MRNVLPIVSLFVVVLGYCGPIDERVVGPSVMVKAGEVSGSGVLFRVADKVYVLTAGHVVAGLREEEEVLDEEKGETKKVVRWQTLQITQWLVEDGQRVGETITFADVTNYSKEEDVAVALVRKKNYGGAVAQFIPVDRALKAGDAIYHVGAPAGLEGSLTSGIVSALGREYERKTYFQCTTPAGPGSSGGGIFLADGLYYVGMVTLGLQHGDSFHFAIPADRLRKWLISQKLGEVAGVK